MTETATLVFITLTFLLAGWVKGVIGLGLPTVAMGLLSLTMPPVQAAALMVIPSLVTNIWQALAGPAIWPLLRRFGLMMIAIVVGTLISIGLLTGSDTGFVKTALGLVLIAYGAIGLHGARMQIHLRLEPLLSPVAGFVTGVISGSTGIFVIPATPYFSALGLEKEQLIQALGLSFSISTLALAGGLLMHGQFELRAATTSLIAVVPAFAGMIAGQYLRKRLPQDSFRRWFFVAMLALGVYMVLR